MPGVADTERKTKLAQEQLRRKKDMEELARLVREGRLHEASAYQLELLRVVQEVVRGQQASSPAPVTETSKEIDEEQLAEKVAAKLAAALGQVIPKAISGVPTEETRARPQMRHVSLDLAQEESELQINVDSLGDDKESEDKETTSSKLEKLRRIKGTK